METSSGTVEGTCLQMCPEKEILMRETEGLLHQLEALTISGDNSDSKPRCRKADLSKTVKQFSRPAAGRTEANPSDLRPASVLKETVTYLFERIAPRDNPAWSSIYEFVFDRLRAVRQDMVIQGIIGADAIGLLENIIRFHLYASYRTRWRPSFLVAALCCYMSVQAAEFVRTAVFFPSGHIGQLRSSDVADFDPVINKQHLLECLKRLLYLYQVTPGCHTSRPEFESVYLLSNLGDSSALTHILDLRPDIRKNQLIHQCYEISIAYVMRNYTRALRLISRLSCAMCLCAVNPHMENLRINYLQILSAGYSVKNCRFPISKLRQILYLDSDDEAVNLCSRCGLIDLFDNMSAEYVCFNRFTFSLPKECKAPTALPVLDKMLKQASVSGLLLGKVHECQGVFIPEKPTRGVGRGRGRRE